MMRMLVGESSPHPTNRRACEQSTHTQVQTDLHIAREPKRVLFVQQSVAYKSNLGTVTKYEVHQEWYGSI